MSASDDAGRRLIDETIAPRRESQLAVLAGSVSDPLPVGRTDLLYLWDEYGAEYLDFAAVMHPFGHRYLPLRNLIVEHIRYYGWTAPPGRHLLRWPVLLAERLSAAFTGADEEPWQVLFCEGQRDAVAQALVLASAGRDGEPLVLRSGNGPVRRDAESDNKPNETLESVNWSQVSVLLVELVDRSYAPVPFLREWMVAARDAGVPVVFDESVTGFGRTGAMWAQEHVGLVADMTVLGGPVGGGLPLGAVVAPARFFPPSMDMSPHAGHPWACAAGFVVMDTLNPAMLTHAGDCGREIANVLGEVCEQFPERLAGHHGVGLLRGLRFRDPAAAAALPAAALLRGLHLAPAVGNTILLTPVLVSSPNEMRRGLEIIADTVLSWDDDVAPGQPGAEGQ